MISIITPVYNTGQFLVQFIESVLKQNYGSWELVLVDDSSTDNSLEICNKYSDSDERIKVISQNWGG